MKATDQIKLRGDDGSEAVVEYTVDCRDGEEAVKHAEAIEEAVEDALPDEWR